MLTSVTDQFLSGPRGVRHKPSPQAGVCMSEGKGGTREIRAEYSAQLNKSRKPGMQEGSLSLSTAIDRPKCTHRQMFV